MACAQLVFVNGRYAPELSSLRSLPQGVRVGSLAAVLHADHRRRTAPGALRQYQDHAFVALNTAFMEDGAFVYVPPGVSSRRRSICCSFLPRMESPRFRILGT